MSIPPPPPLNVSIASIPPPPPPLNVSIAGIPPPPPPLNVSVDGVPPPPPLNISIANIPPSPSPLNVTKVDIPPPPFNLGVLDASPVSGLSPAPFSVSNGTSISNRADPTFLLPNPATPFQCFAVPIIYTTNRVEFLNQLKDTMSYLRMCIQTSFQTIRDRLDYEKSRLLQIQERANIAEAKIKAIKETNGPLSFDDELIKVLKGMRDDIDPSSETEDYDEDTNDDDDEGIRKMPPTGPYGSKTKEKEKEKEKEKGGRDGDVKGVIDVKQNPSLNLPSLDDIRSDPKNTSNSVSVPSAAAATAPVPATVLVHRQDEGGEQGASSGFARDLYGKMIAIPGIGAKLLEGSKNMDDDDPDW